jgi:shikimate kinase/3-dehydroquinate synthase
MAAPAELIGPGRKLVLIGFMAAGKTSGAAAAAEVLRSRSVDVDEVVEQRLGKPIPQVFEEDGEAVFRAAEADAALEILQAPDVGVVSLGGGTILHEPVRQALKDHLVLWLDVDADTAYHRAKGPDRPLARDRDRFSQMLADREPLYRSLADVIVPGVRSDRLPAVLDALQGVPEGTRVLWAASASADYPVYVGRGLVEGGFWPAGVEGRRFLVTDGQVARLYAGSLEPLAARVSIMPGEQSKTVAHADVVWSELVRAGMTRQDLVVALGGGVVGDLAGFCAATYQRGVRWVGVPTTLVAQVDSAYGGKTGVDLAEAKNYVGAYHQPSAVITDPDTLDSLPEAELAAGYAEVVKTALIAGGELWHQVSSGAEPGDPEVILSCVLVKLRVVSRDERDSGLRQVLNLGHTVGHAIETVTGYARFRHGEAVGLGLLAALRLSDQPDLRQTVAELLATRGLPVTLDDVDPDAVVMATARDKKRLGDDPVRFVLLDGPGRPRVGQDVDSRALIGAVRELSAR